MPAVEPIKDRKKINKIKRMMEEDKKYRELALFKLGLNSALRVSDLLKLKWQDLFDEKGEYKEQVTVKEKKTGKSKGFPLEKETKKYLDKIREDGSVYSDEEYVFKTHSNRNLGTHWSRQYVYIFLNSYARRAKVEARIGSHTMRKSFGYHAYQTGVSIEKLQKILNHSSKRETLDYIGITQEELNEVYLSLNL